MTGNTAKANGGMSFNKSFREILPGSNTEPAQSSEEIISRLRSKLRKYGAQG